MSITSFILFLLLKVYYMQLSKVELDMPVSNSTLDYSQTMSFGGCMLEKVELASKLIAI